jgi:hypothetical protein
MLIIELLVNENLIKAEIALNKANSGDIIELCREYLQILTEYRDELYKLRGVPETTLPQSSLARELIEQVRRSIRTAIEITTRERNKTELLLKSFTSISGYEAVDTFNRLKFRGFDNWELKSNSVNSHNDGSFDQIAMQEAIETAGLLRREAYLAGKTIFLQLPDSGALSSGGL